MTETLKNKLLSLLAQYTKAVHDDTYSEPEELVADLTDDLEKAIRDRTPDCGGVDTRGTY